jgi:F-type H+-transporting ATPase subunit delta
MTISVIGKRYARALLSLASDANAIARVQADLRDFAQSWESNRDLRAVFENPAVSQQTRRSILREVAQTTQMHDVVRDLLQLLADRQRLRHVGEIADAFAAMAEQRLGKLRAEVVTASQLPPGYFAELERVLHDITGKQVVIVHRVDASLIGGVTTRIGDQVFDGSVKSRLSELGHELLN